MEDEALGPLLCKGSKAYRRLESQASNTKRLKRVKYNTLMCQAIMILQQNKPEIALKFGECTLNRRNITR